MLNANQHRVSYNDLQQSVDELVGRHGLEKAVRILQQFTGNTGSMLKPSHKLKLIADYIVTCCVEVFDLEADRFHTSEVREYREARMACYHLLKKYTDSSYARIGQRFGRSLDSVFYFCQKCNDMLSIPHFYKSFAERYTSLERSIVDFISKL